MEEKVQKMKLLTKIKNKIIHWCGGYTFDDLPQRRIIRTEYPIEHLKFNYRYFPNMPKELIDKEMAHLFAKAILENKLYTEEIVNSIETPKLLNASYSIYIARPKEN